MSAKSVFCVRVIFMVENNKLIECFLEEHDDFLTHIFLADLSRHGEMQDGAGEEREGLSGREG